MQTFTHNDSAVTEYIGKRHISVTDDRRRQGKFQPFRRLFGRKRRRETEQAFEEEELKPSHSTGDVCNGVVSGHEEDNQHLREVNPLGSRAFSHESIFIPEDSAENPLSSEQIMSQENVSDKVRNLQRQIAHNIKFGQKPPSLRRSEGDEGSSDEEEIPRSPLRVLAQVETEPQEAEAREKVSSATHDVAQHKTPVKSPRTKRPPPPGTIESINLDAVPQSGPRLDNTAAKHKLSVKPKNQRISRKHRRFTQEILEEDLSAFLQEEIGEEPGVWREEYARSHQSRDDQEPPEKSKKQRLQEEEHERLELQRKREQEEQRRRDEERRAEELRLDEERRRRLEEERLQREEEERRQREEERRRKEEEERRREEERMREEEEKRREEERRKKEMEARRRAEEERRQQELEAERLRLEEEKRKREAEEEKRKKEEEEAAEKQRLWELEEKRCIEEERLREEQRRRQEEAEEKKKKEEEERAAEEQGGAPGPEWKRKAEELRWREMEERQRPFTFKVSSGEKQILFQKVNLTPVTPVPGQHGEQATEAKEGTPGSADSPTLSSSLYVPHTAILVTGAQLCGTAVNLDQIKDTACKSLLGLSEDKKAMTTSPVKGKTSPDRKSGKTKSLSESVSVDQSSAAVLAEWASIRSKIFKGAEDGKYQEPPDQNCKQAQSPTASEDLNQPPFSHANLRKTMSASAKFSITPARKKFADSNRNSEVLSPDEKEGDTLESPTTDSALSQPLPSPSSAAKAQSKGGKTVRISDSADECKFAKDLPSFLVPSPPQGSPKSQRSESFSSSQMKSEETDTNNRDDPRDLSGEERPSPFGIKLRRTNYSLRFHSEQSTEKRKKRYSAGDSFDGVPVPLTSTNQDSDSDKNSPTSPLRETDGVKLQTVPSTEPRPKSNRNSLTSVCSERDKLVSKPPLYQKPATSPKPSEGATPPPSPLPKPSRRTSGDTISQKTEAAEPPSPEESSDRKEDPSESVQNQKNGQGDEEPKEKKSFFPSISIPWREKTDRKTELIRREKPSLQSRHSLDSSRAQEKEAGPLWITLALQKQKGFREQQQSREEKRNQREAKLAEKQARDRESVGLLSPTEAKGNGNSSPPKPQTPEENKRPETLLTRLERRDLKKANTLPSSVTVEIADSTPSPPAAKDMTKRFPPGDAPQVSTEPAWLALAKRKAKAWSDCPQIIK
ncbi:capping protein inhibiting regulator of actin dynamics isoform X1 [Astyanax mexicanus]|uniref:capping protein inhibiting regulator of actin dynamics isoform X1 n=2 Tax=Astyanax mexicanus TaxID=7994 RepID=UPI0020CB07A5|nr:capping protein inhibiting regulator of actin dynamics isoform X1 [Astyanax mexicanus]